MTHEDELIKLLNETWALIPLKPKYNDFNVTIPFGEYCKALEVLEQANQKLGLSDFRPYPDPGPVPEKFQVLGISTLSLIATITDVLCSRRLAAIIEDDGTISGWTFVEAG